MAQSAQAALAVAEAEQAVLRVLAGPQRGAELPLHQGEYRIGTGEHCDVVLADNAAADVHVVLSLGEKDVSIEAGEKPVALADRVLRPGEQATVPLPAALTFGLTSIGIGARDADWAALALPEPPGPEAGAPQEGEEAAVEEAGETSQADSETAAEPGAGGEADAQPAAADVAAISEASQAKPKTSRRGWRAALWAVPAVLLVVGMGFAVLHVWRAPDSRRQHGTAAASIVTPVDSAKAIVDRLALREVMVQPGPTGTPVLAGFVPDKAKHADLQQALRQAGLTVDDQLREVDNLMGAIRLTLGSFAWPEPNFSAHLKTSYGGNGSVIIDGFLGPEVDRGVLVRRVKGDVPGLASLEFRRAGLGDWKAILDGKLAAAGLGQWLKTEPRAGQLRVSGEVTESEAASWRSVGQDFVNESGGWPKLAIAVTKAGPPPDPTLPQAAAMAQLVGPEQAVPQTQPADDGDPRVIGVILSQDGPGRVLLADGQSLVVGEAMENGTVIKAVTADKVVFHRGEREFVVYVKESK